MRTIFGATFARQLGSAALGYPRLDADDLQFVVLSQIAYGVQRHGYGMAAAINERFDTSYTAKHLYPVLRQLEKSGLTVVVHTRECMAGPGKYDHTITEAGKARLAVLEKELWAKAERIRRMMDFVKSAERKAK